MTSIPVNHLFAYCCERRTLFVLGILGDACVNGGRERGFMAINALACDVVNCMVWYEGCFGCGK